MSAPADPAAPERELEDLLGYLRDARGFDFTGYKRTSLARRIRKRMADVGTAAYGDYRDVLETDPEEFNELFNTILINVTGFFRDSESWAYLAAEALPQILADKAPDDEIRIWSAGCSTGEEAYTLAILFAEAIGLEECARRLKIYGTDVDEEALREARGGVYPHRALEALAPELRERYFETAGGNHAFRADLRRRVIFGRHDITRDAPISRLDLLVCRNTLMYFNMEAQSQIIERFHFALRPGGYLFLGKAEMLLSEGERFQVDSMRHRLFRRRIGNTPLPHTAVLPRLEVALGRDVRDVGRKRLVRDLALDTSPHALIALDEEGAVVIFNNQARTLFGLTPADVNRPFQDLELSYRPVELRSLIEQAADEGRTVRVAAVERPTAGGESQFLDINIQPLFSPDGERVGVALSFLDTTVATRLQHELQRIRQDLESAYEALQSTNEELETTNEELQSSIEELETTNEELQSTNEELETTNEELESGNEELQTMNEELRSRTAELDEAHAFLAGVLTSIAAGVVVLDGELRVRSWNRGAEDLWGLRTAEVDGQPFFGLDFGLPTAQLQEAVQECRGTGRRIGPVHLSAVNRIGRRILCSIACSPLDQDGGVVLLMEQVQAED
ncbi:PAS domain-containing protein [Actinospica sp. MGRD01-02]|uniref:protein-glutamate O-methyltransferase n=1 Tax=Actinospica acidithermotolerans TaxID=2828514 RepID=A0A941E6Z7_9ACTN|nr:protein-glutamate O-methyltransferase CheR [Actinospica acidithermotolerans]MBR7825083.1 PAS domain-containing protein [Actinospica acidithermotolerans]